MFMFDIGPHSIARSLFFKIHFFMLNEVLWRRQKKMIKELPSHLTVALSFIYKFLQENTV